MVFDQQQFNRFIIDNDVIGFFEKPITLKSGRVTHWYINWRTVTEDVYRTDQLTDFLISFIETKGLSPDCIYGVPDGATKLGVVAQYKWSRAKASYAPGSHVLAMGRKTPKDHGDAKDKFFVGAPTGKTIVIEDTTTTGGSLLVAIDQLQRAGIEIIAAIGFSNRNEKRDDGMSVAEAVKAKGVDYLAMSNVLELLPEAIQQQNVGEDIRQAVVTYFEQYGIEPLSL